MSTSCPLHAANAWILVAFALGISLPSEAHAQPATPPVEEPAGAAAPSPAGEPAAAEAAPPAPPAETDADTNAADTNAADTEPPVAEAAAEESGAEVVTGGGLFESSIGDEAAGEETAAGDSVARGFELNGFVRGDLFVGKVPHQRRGEIKAGYGELGLQARAKGGKHGDAFAELRLRYGQELDRYDLFLDLREAYASLYWGRLDLRLGHQIIVWGRADGFNPTNNLTPHDLRIRSPNEDDRRLGNMGARAIVDLKPVRLEGVWMPLYRAIELPPVETYSFVTMTEDYPKPELSNGLFAGRVHLELPAFEASVSFLHGYSLLPGLMRDRRVVGRDTGVGFSHSGSPIEVFVSRRPYQHNVLGFDFSTAVSDLLGIRGEVAYRRPLDADLPWYELRPAAKLDPAAAAAAPLPDLQYVLGLDHTFGPVMVIVQYLGRYTFDWSLRPPLADEDRAAVERLIPADGFFNLDTGDPASLMAGPVDQEVASKSQILFQQTAEVQHLASLRVEWLTLHDTLSLSVLGLVNFTTGEWAALPKVSYQFSDHLSGAVGGEIYAGPENTLLGLIDETLTGGYAELRVSF